MSSNVIPSAPHDERLYPQLPQLDYRMQKANKVESTLNAEVNHYRIVAKKYKRAKKIVNWSATGCGFLSAGLSTASLGTAVSVVGLPASIPLGSVGGAFALASSGLIVAGKKLDSKIKKHREIFVLATAKRDTIRRLYSKALSDNQISDSEFQAIMAEFSQYNTLKEAIRSKMAQNSSLPDIEKIKKKCPKRDRGRIPEKNQHSCRRFELTFKNSRLYLHIIKT